MEKNCAPLPTEVFPQTFKTPMKGSDLDLNNGKIDKPLKSSMQKK